MPPAGKEPEIDRLINVIARAEAEVVLIGGVAMILLGADNMTQDMDICYRREKTTISKLCRALAPYAPMLRAALLDYQDLLLNEDVGLDTEFGHIDIMGSISGIGEYDQVLALAEPIEIEGQRLMVLGLDGLIRAKEAAGRDKDKLHLATLRALRALRDE